MQVLLCDVDGVLGAFVPHLLKALKSKLKPSQITTWELFQELEPEEREKSFQLLETPEWWDTMPVITGAKKGIKRLSKKYEVVFITAPWYGCFGWADVRREWLKHHFDVNIPLIVTPHKEYVAGDIFMDDRPANLDKWCKAWPGKRALLYDASYNRSTTQFERVSWAEGVLV